MAVTEKQLIEELKTGQYKPVYLLTGDENYYIDLVSDYFEKEVISPDFRDFDQTVVYGRDVDMTAVISLAKRYPMMSPVQLVLVKEAQDISKGWELLATYLENPQPQTLLVFCYRYKKFDKRTKLYKAISAKGVIYEKNKLRDYEVPGWIANIVSQRGYSITQKGAVLIAESLGNDLAKIANELSKVYISLPQGSVINEDVIESDSLPFQCVEHKIVSWPKVFLWIRRSAKPVLIAHHDKLEVKFRTDEVEVTNHTGNKLKLLERINLLVVWLY